MKSNKNKRGKINREIDKIHKHIYRDNNLLQIYEEELHDLAIHFKIDYTQYLKTLDKFLDFFVDSLITDWVIKHRIENSLKLVNNAVDKITRINSMLEEDIRKTDNVIKDLEMEKAEAIVIALKDGVLE